MDVSLTQTKQRPGIFRRRMCLHRASIAVCKPTPHCYTPGARLPFHPSTSALVMKWSLNTKSARRVRSDKSSDQVGKVATARLATSDPPRGIPLPNCRMERDTGRHRLGSMDRLFAVSAPSQNVARAKQLTHWNGWLIAEAELERILTPKSLKISLR
jgi:hypothetical protein